MTRLCVRSCCRWFTPLSSPRRVTRRRTSRRARFENAATYFADHFRDAASIPLIIPLLTTDDDSYLRASSVLFHLTAVDSVPGSPKVSTVERRQVRAFWERWWVEHGPSFVPADRVAGEAAEARWWRRRR